MAAQATQKNGWSALLWAVLAAVFLLGILLSVFATIVIREVVLEVREEEQEEDEYADEPYFPYIGERYVGDATPTERQKTWALATCGMLVELNNDSHYVLGGDTNTVRIAKMLKHWDVCSREGLLDTLEWFENGGHRQRYDRLREEHEELSSGEQTLARHKAFSEGGTVSNRMDVMLATRERFTETSIAGFDFSRYVFLCGCGYQVGYLTEEEAWDRIMPVARLLQEHFPSWNELYDNYTEGRRFWSLATYLDDGEELLANVNDMKWEAYSPLRHLPWDMSLLPEEQKDDGSKEFRLGRAYYDSFGKRGSRQFKEADQAEAVRLFTAAAEKGNIDAMCWLGLCHWWGAGGLKSDMAQVTAWLTKAAELGDAQAMILLADVYHSQEREDLNKVFEWSRKAVDAGGGPRAEHWLGMCHEFGFGTGKSYAEAFKWYEKAAKAGFPMAQNYYACCFRDGDGAEKNPATAAVWFRKSAEGGYNRGMHHWAQCLERGAGVAKNKEEALRWYKKAAEAGHDGAKKRLAELEAEQAKPAASDGRNG